MNKYIEGVYRGVVISEDAIDRLNKTATRLVKHCIRTSARVTCIGVAVGLITALVVTQNKEIKTLKEQVSNLKANTNGTMEE